MGHARAILGLPNEEGQIEVANRAAAHGQSVRDVERIVRRLTDERPATDASADKPQDPNVKAAAEQLQEILGTRVRIVEKTEQRGRIEIEYYTQDDLQRIYGLIAKDT
jgi:ParB family chromosome partitioning protein